MGGIDQNHPKEKEMQETNGSSEVALQIARKEEKQKARKKGKDISN